METLDLAARLAGLSASAELFIPLRVLIVIACGIVIHAQLRGWRQLNFCRRLTVGGYALIALGFLLSAILTGRTGSNTPAYQLLIQAGVLMRLTADAMNAGHRRSIRRRREGRNREH